MIEFDTFEESHLTLERHSSLESVAWTHVRQDSTLESVYRGSTDKTFFFVYPFPSLIRLSKRVLVERDMKGGEDA